MSLSSWRIQWTSGREKSLLLAVDALRAGTPTRSASLRRIYFCVLPRSFHSGGRPVTHSTKNVVEDGNANFQRVQHAHAIDFGEDVVDHVGFGVDVERWLTGSFAGAAAKRRRKTLAGRRCAVEDGAEIVGEQRRVALEGGQEGEVVDVALLPRQRYVVAEFAAPSFSRSTRGNICVAIEFARPSGNVLEDLPSGLNDR